MSSLASRTPLQWAIVVSYVICVALNGASASGVLGLPSNKVISDKYRNAFTPAAYAFSIWSVIYIALAALCGYAFSPARAEWTRDKLGWPLVVNLLTNAIWLPIFQSEFLALWPSVLLIFAGILAPLIQLYQSLGVGGWRGPPVSYSELLCAHFAISIYLGWLIVACVANVACALTPAYGVANLGWSASGWSIVMQIVASALGAVFLVQKGDPVIPSVIIWALVAISVVRGGGKGEWAVLVAPRLTPLTPLTPPPPLSLSNKRTLPSPVAQPWLTRPAPWQGCSGVGWWL